MIVTLATSLYGHTDVADNAPSSAIEYAVNLRDARNHYVTVEMRVPTPPDQTELMMAVWTPGSYLLREHARHIDSLVFTDEHGNELSATKLRKNRWTVSTKKIERLNVRYRLYCNEMSVRTNWVGSEFAVLNGAPTFLTVPDRMASTHIVKLVLPEVWNQSSTSLRSSGSLPHQYRAKNFDELVDSPIVAGNIQVYPFEVGGIPHQLVNVGAAGYWDGAKAAADLKQIVQAHRSMWKVTPYDRYLFINVISESGGGLEHDFCTLLMTSRWSFRDQEKYEDWLSLASHEFFHTWNVRRLRPKDLLRYDYEKEVYTPSLWIAEGITSYYEDVLLARAGLIKEEDYLKRLSKNIESVQSAAGRTKQSLTAASFDTWIKFYRPDENSLNTRTSYYRKGAVVAFLLDARIRELTHGERNLDDVMRKLYAERIASGYTPSDFRRITSQVAKNDMSEWFTKAVDSTDELDFSYALNWFGLEFGPGDEPHRDGDTSESNRNDTSDGDAKPTPWLGFVGIAPVTRVEDNSPATESGVHTDDEIIAIDGFRLTDDLESRLKQFQIGDELELLISRRGKILTLPIRVSEKPASEWLLRPIENPSEKQIANRTQWLSPE